MKKFLVLGALSLFCLGGDVCEAMAAGAPAPGASKKLVINKNNLARLDTLLTGEQSSVRVDVIVGKSLSDTTTVLKKLDNATVQGVEQLGLDCIFNDDQANHLLNIIKRNSESLKSFSVQLGLKPGPTKLKCIDIIDALSKCPYLEYASLAAPYDVYSLANKLMKLSLCQGYVANEIKKMVSEQEELKTLISQARAQAQGDQLADQPIDAN